jgi:hypothetical protein
MPASVVLLPPPGPLLVKPQLHLLQHLGSVPHYQLDRPMSLFQQFHSLLMILSFNRLQTASRLHFLTHNNTHHSIHAQQLVAAFQPSMSVCNAPRNNPGDVDRRVLLFAPHHVKSESLFGLGELDDAGVRVSLAGGERRDGCLGGGGGAHVLRALDVDGFVDVLVDLPHRVEEVALEDFLQGGEFRSGDFAALLQLLQQFDGAFDVWK